MLINPNVIPDLPSLDIVSESKFDLSKYVSVRIATM